MIGELIALTVTELGEGWQNVTVPSDAASSTASPVSPVAPSGTASPSRDEPCDLSIINFRVGPLRL